tara:strand:- start:334 stop:1503 length:1170 start_codon:yes stop_codon:yes gene_type:complete
MAATQGGVSNNTELPKGQYVSKRLNIPYISSYEAEQGGVKIPEYQVSDAMKVPQGESFKNYKGANVYDNKLYNTLSANIFKIEDDNNLFTPGEGGVQIPRDQTRTYYENLNNNLNEYAEKGHEEYMNTRVETGIDLSYQSDGIHTYTDFESGEEKQMKSNKGGFAHLFNVLDKANSSFNKFAIKAAGADEGWLEREALGAQQEWGEGNITMEHFEDMDHEEYLGRTASATAEKLPFIRAFQQMKNDISMEYFGVPASELLDTRATIDKGSAQHAKQKFDEIVEAQGWQVPQDNTKIRRLRGEFLQLMDLTAAKTNNSPMSITGFTDKARTNAERIFGGSSGADDNWIKRFHKTSQRKPGMNRGWAYFSNVEFDEAQKERTAYKESKNNK